VSQVLGSKIPIARPLPHEAEVDARIAQDPS